MIKVIKVIKVILKINLQEQQPKRITFQKCMISGIDQLTLDYHQLNQLFLEHLGAMLLLSSKKHQFVADTH